jgi:5-(carboxyamino)imidazole ribonucleotide synthase
MILPGAALGMLGGGQLGRMFTIAAKTMGYRVIVLDPDPKSPAGEIADLHLQADYQDEIALDRLARECSAITTEFENVPAATLETLATRCTVSPGPWAVAVSQDRIREKNFLRSHEFPTAPFVSVHNEDDLIKAFSEIKPPAILKVSRFGYDGKGQAKVANLHEALAAWNAMKREPCVLEGLMQLDAELSAILARGAGNEMAVYPLSENSHVNGILDITVAPAWVSQDLAWEAQDMAREIAIKLEYVGVLAVEFFFSQGSLLVNEIAPRPHNSGHYTIDACVTSQFEQQVRALCGLPLGDARLLSPVAMVNLLGDLWRNGEPHWEHVLKSPRAKLHLYGKREARPGRKMGHYTCLATTAVAAREEALKIKRELEAC